MQMTLTLPRLHRYQSWVKSNASRWNILCCGRRFGKTTLGIELLLDPALDGFPTAWFAPNYKLLKEAWRELKRVAGPAIKDKSESEHRIELLTKGVIEFWSLDNADSVARGRKYKRAMVDEAVLVRSLKSAWQESIRPTLIDYRGDGWLFSTPRGINFFSELFERGNPQNSDRNPQYRSFQLPSWCNPHLPKAEIREMQFDMTQRGFEQEVEAKILPDGNGVFRYYTGSGVTHCARQERAIDGHTYVFGLDWGRSKDFTVVSIFDETLKACVNLDRFNQVGYTVQRNRIKGLYERFKPHTILAESNSIGEVNIENLKRDGLPVRPFFTSNASKANAVEALQLAFERGDIHIIKDPILIGELGKYEEQRLSGGLVKYGAPDGYHDDCVTALFIGWHACSIKKTRLSDFEI